MVLVWSQFFPNFFTTLTYYYKTLFYKHFSNFYRKLSAFRLLIIIKLHNYIINIYLYVYSKLYGNLVRYFCLVFLFSGNYFKSYSEYLIKKKKYIYISIKIYLDYIMLYTIIYLIFNLEVTTKIDFKINWLLYNQR